MHGKRTLVITIALLAMLVTSGWAATLEVTQPVQVTSDSYYERGQAIVYDGSDYWLFYGRSASCNTPYSGATNPDVYDYVLYYKTAGTVAGLASATATQVLVGATPVTSSYMGETAAAYFGSNVWVFATIHDGMSNTDLYGYYTGDGGTTWTQVGPYVAGMSGGQGHHDEIVFGGEVWILEGSGDFHTMHSSTPTNAGSFGTPLQVGSTTGGLGHFFVDGTDLYLALGSAGTYYIHKYNSGTVAWDLVDSKTISGYYDPTLFKVGSDYVFYCAPCSGGRQWIVGWTSTTLDSAFFDGPQMDVIEGRYGSNEWVDMWPIGFTSGGTSYLFYSSERDIPSAEGAGNIWYTEVDWDVSNDHYTYVQNAVDEALSGDDLAIATGTYREQLKIDGKSLDLVGAGIGSTIIEAVDVIDRTIYNITQWTAPARPIDACIGVVGPATVNISDLTVDGRELGPNNFYGIHFFDTSGSVTGCRIEDILYAASPGADKVVSLVATHSVVVTAYTIDFSGNVIPNFQKGGVLLMGPYLTFTVDDNEITNVPSSSLAGNGIQLSYGSAGSTSGNVVDGVAYLGEDWTATGILLFESGDITMDGDVVYNCQTAVDYSNWGWIYPSPTVVNISVADLLLYDNGWSLGAQLSANNADLTFAADGCVILDSTGDGIDLYGTGIDPWGGFYYTGWDNGDLIADITNCVIVGTTLDGMWVDDYSGNATNTMDIEVHDTSFESNVGSGVWNSSSYTVDATYCWWGDPFGPTVLPPGRDTRPAKPPVSPFGDELPEQGEVRYTESSSSRSVSGVYGPVAYTPWLTANIVCVPDPESLTATDPVKTIDVDYLGGSVLMYGYTVKVRWDGSIVSTEPVKVTEGTLLSGGVPGTTFFYPRMTGTNEITVDCMLLGDDPGVTGSGTMFSVEFTGFALGTSDVGIIVDRVRDKDNNTLTGFVADYGLLIVDLTNPTVTDVLITNDDPDVSDVYVKDGDPVTVTAAVSDDDPTFSGANIEADLSGLGGASDANPGTYDGTTATWVITSVSCTPADDEHEVTVTVMATDPIGNTANANDTIIADNLAPTAVTVFDASPAHEECSLTWTNGTDTYYEGTVIQRADVSGEYPQYPWFVGNWPSVDTAYPGSELLGTNVYDDTGTSHTDVVVDRNIYYYQAFSYDGARNYSTADAGARDLATNYWLGDVSDVWGSWGYDGEVDTDDILKLSDSYGLSSPTGNEAECDVGPTVHPDWHRLGLPLPDDIVEFEDAMIFAMNYGVVAAKVVPFLPEEHSTDVLALTLSEREMVGSEVEIALRLEGNVDDVKGVSAIVSYATDELEFMSARLSDDMSLPLADVFFWSGTEEGRVLVDALVLGTDVTIGGSGDVAVLTFRVVGDGYLLEVESARIRNADNVELDAKLGDCASGGEMPLVFRLVQNAPNPFNPVTKVAYHVPRESEVTIRVFDVSGRVVTTLVDGVVEAGRHAAVWNGRNDAGESVGSGIYFCTMEAPDFHDSRKMTLLK